MSFVSIVRELPVVREELTLKCLEDVSGLSVNELCVVTLVDQDSLSI